METVKVLINSKFKTILLLSVALSFSIVLLVIRMKLNKSFFYLFLVWNVLLAIIPYVITVYLDTKPNLSKLKLGFWFIAWLLFLPNAPYIVTDLIHIRIGSENLLWLDVLVVLSFAMSGLFLFYFSVLDMQRLLKSKFRYISTQSLTLTVMFLCGFGVYLGRFLRYNSWEILSQPHYLIADIFNIIASPFQNYDAWLFTFGFSAFLIVGFWIFKILLDHPRNLEDN